jgi:parvulin-like peptidyl-prolyl isomerase
MSMRVLDATAFARPGTAGPQNPIDIADPVIAVVGDHRIRRSALDLMLERRMASFTRTGRELTPAWRNRQRLDLLNRLIETALLEIRMDEAGIEVTDEQLQAHVSAQIVEIFTTEEHFGRYLERRGLPRNEYEGEQRFNLRLAQLFELFDPINVTDDDVSEYYQLVRENWRAPERVHAYNIVKRLPRNATEEDETVAFELMNEIQATALLREESFQALAREHSLSSNSSIGGDLGWIYRDDNELDARSLEVLFGLGVGEISAPVRTLVGVEIFTVTAHRTEGYRDFDEVRESLYGQVVQREERGRRGQIVNDTRLRTDIVRVEGNIGLEPE